MFTYFDDLGLTNLIFTIALVAAIIIGSVRGRYKSLAYILGGFSCWFFTFWISEQIGPSTINLLIIPGGFIAGLIITFTGVVKILHKE